MGSLTAVGTYVELLTVTSYAVEPSVEMA